jgi:nucleotide-binding universal stress UspA family protein
MGRRLVFGDDGSASADAAWAWINHHQWPNWTIDVVTARHHGRSAAVPPRALLHTTVAGGVRTTIVDGDAGTALRNRADGSDLLVVGHKGHGLLKALHLGSVAESLVHAAPAPLVIVRKGVDTRRVLLAHDGSVHSRAAERAVAALPWADHLSVLMLTVAQSGQQGADILAAAVDRLSAAVGALSTQVVTPRDLHLFYTPREIILEWVDSWRADLVALGRSGLAGWDPVDTPGPRRAGATALGLANHSPCSVLLADDSP